MPPPIQTNVSLRAFNTFGLNAEASALVRIASVQDAADIIKLSPANALPKWILGGGSNILLTGNVPALVLKVEIPGIETVLENADFVWLKAGAGVVWNDLVQYAVARNLGGLENMSLIPGTVGAAPLQNIGAYGTELKDVFESLEAISLHNASVRVFNLEECKFAYRDSVFKNEAKGQYMVTSVTIRLRKKPELNTSYGAIMQVLEENGEKPSVKSISDAVVSIRRSKLPDPAVLGNAGSFFRNPEIPAEQFNTLKESYPNIPSYPAPGGVKVPAGWLIEQSGWKGKRVGNAGVHAQQALVLVNFGGATGAEIRQLAFDVCDSVEGKFGIRLNPEVNFIPEQIQQN
ncbi:MAG: UDP-N-acetylmuramate dehydrogenase [Bacteroidota bacterium]